MIKKNNGFTLIEMIIVIAILGIVLAIAAPHFTEYRDNANLKEAARDLSSDIQFYKQRAVSENVQYTITFNDPAINQYTIRNAVATVATKNVGAGNALISVYGTPNFGGTTLLVLNPRGTTGAGHLHLKHIRPTLKKAKITTTLMGKVYVTYNY